MSTILVLCVIATAAWVVLGLFGRAADNGPKDSVDDFSRALSALSSGPGPRRRAPTRRPPARGGSRTSPSRTRASRTSPSRTAQPAGRTRRDPLSTR